MTPYLAPTPVARAIAVGVASPKAQGQAETISETAKIEAAIGIGML